MSLPSKRKKKEKKLRQPVEVKKIEANADGGVTFSDPVAYGEEGLQKHGGHSGGAGCV